jgi:ELP3 family radical SAM enzyme/protein acetyltransferase
VFLKQNLYTKMQHIEDIEDIEIKKKKKKTFETVIITPFQYNDIKEYMKCNNVLNWDKFSRGFQREYRYALSKNMLREVYMKETHKPAPRQLIKKACRSQYGILNVCVFTSAYPEYVDEEGVKQKQMFSCKHNCYYCPSEPNQPRSYLMDEPGVARANECDFDCVKQFHMRLNQYKGMGHPLDKIEFEVSGGTWSEYPRVYQREFMRDGYYAANTFNKEKRDRLTLEEEIKLNEHADIHIIGLTIETRPDTIHLEELKLFREYNVTRVQIGVQHTDNKILKKINRGHTIEESMRAIRMLLNNGFKVDIHLMPMLPGATPDIDREMFEEVLNNPNLQVDQWKVYPTSVVPWSVLEEWYKKGKYKPYTNEELFDVLIEMKRKVHNRIRLIRIVRDINDHYIIGGCSVTHMRQLLLDKLKKEEEYCKCIRCRSVKTNKIDKNHKLRIDKFNSSDGLEYFISYVSDDERDLYGFCRLRITNDDTEKIEEIHKCALIRELHVYSTLTPVNNTRDKYLEEDSIQHKGFGKRLLKRAEEIASYHNYKLIAVISGVGVREYYRKQGYVLETTYMKKEMSYISRLMNVLMCLIVKMSIMIRKIF